MKKFNLLSFIFIFIFISCGGETSSKNKSKENIQSLKPTIQNSSKKDIVSQLNEIRKNISLNSLSINRNLNNSSLNHSNYLHENNATGHYERRNNLSFTGKYASQRANNAFYNSKFVLENVSTGQKNKYVSFEALMSAIYHRFAFLNFKIDEIGFGYTGKAYVYNMGNSNLNSICKSKDLNVTEKYYFNICKNYNFKIKINNYKEAFNKVINNNPPYIIYPYNNQESVQPVFFEESPDPLPQHSVSGYPISIEFNSNNFIMSKLTINSFILKNDNDNEVELIKHEDSSEILNKQNDLNNKFSRFQFAIFPKYRLDFNKTYNIEFDYTYENENKTIISSFKTKKLDNLIKYEKLQVANINMNLNKQYYIYIEPDSITSTIQNYYISCIHSKSKGYVDISDSSLYDSNTIYLNIKGEYVSSCTINLNNNTREVGINIIN